MLDERHREIMSMLKVPSCFTKTQFIVACRQYFKSDFTLSSAMERWIRAHYLRPKKIRSVERIVQQDGPYKLVFNKGCFEFVLF